jgi:hypothetical protein
MHELPAEPGPDCVTAGEQSAHYEAVLERVTLALLSRIMNRASGLLRINDIDERMELGAKRAPVFVSRYQDGKQVIYQFAQQRRSA